MLLTIVPPTAWGIGNDAAPVPSSGVEAREAVAAALADEQGDPDDPDEPGFFGRVVEWVRNLFTGGDDVAAIAQPAYIGTEPGDEEDNRGPPSQTYTDISDAAEASLAVFSKEDIKPLGLIDIAPFQANLRIDFDNNDPNAITLIGHEYRATLANGTISVGRMPEVPSLADRAHLYWHTCPNGENDCDGVGCYDGRGVLTENCADPAITNGRVNGTTVFT